MTNDIVKTNREMAEHFSKRDPDEYAWIYLVEGRHVSMEQLLSVEESDIKKLGLMAEKWKLDTTDIAVFRS